MSKYTEGKWRLVSDAQGPNMVMHPTLEGVAIASLTNTFIPSRGFHDPTNDDPTPCPEVGVTYHAERVANARLIAAAPDLLEALEAINAHWESGNFSRNPDLWEPMRAAIAKAKGEAV